MKREDTLKDINSKYSNLSKSHKKLADYVITNYDKVIFMTVNEFSKSVGVSESTVVRFAHSLGYSGYPSFQNNLQESIKYRLTSLQRFEHLSEHEGEKNVVKDIMVQDINNIQKTINNLNVEKLKEIAKKIKTAETVYVIGFRSSKVLAEYLTFYLKFIHNNVKIIPVGVNDIYDEIINTTTRDLVIAISFPRYSRQTIEIVKLLRDKKIAVLGLTDSYNSPLAENVSEVLTVNYNIETFVDSLTAPMSLINALIIALSLDNKKALENKLNRLESIWEKQNIYL
ncbi:MAG: MurR/RpiR family transcriptional regulator [Clostridiales bacterium]|nr:MurR/RpiR family transcriptional regulator [Clostridiales bacterium]